MFKLVNGKVKLIRFEIVYIDEGREEVEFCVSEKERDEVENRLDIEGITFSISEVDQTENEWFNGLEFESYDEALEVFNKGEQAYLQEKQRQELTDNLRLRADIDYLAIMSGVEI